MSHGDALSYMLLWDASEHLSSEIMINAFNDATKWPGFPINDINPYPSHVDFEKIGLSLVKPNVPSLGGRKSRRGGPPKYVSLSNYNNLP